MKKSITFLFFFLVSIISCWAQDTIYIAKNGIEVKDRNLMDEYMFIQKDPANKNRAVLLRYFRNGQLKWKVGAINERAVKNKINTTPMTYSYMYDDIIWLYDGNYQEWYQSGKLYKDFQLITGGLVNELKYFWENGNLKRQEVYDSINCKLKSGQCYDANNKLVPYFPSFVTYKYQRYEFNTIDAYFRSKQIYPAGAISRKVEAIIGVYANYDNEGNLADAFVRHPVDKDLDSASIALIKSVPKLDAPAYSDGIAIPQRIMFYCNYNIPYIAYDIVNKCTGTDTVYVDKYNRITKNPKRATNILYFKVGPGTPDEVTYKVCDNKKSLISLTHISKAAFNRMFKQMFKDPYKNTFMSTRQIIDLLLNINNKINELQIENTYGLNNNL